MKEKCIICDLDNVYVDSREWNKYIPVDKEDRNGWDLFQEHMNLCKPNTKIINCLTCIVSLGVPILFVTSRENVKDMYRKTMNQIEKFSKHKIIIGDFNKLYMRDYADYRTACEVKKDLLEKFILPKYEPILAIDDELDNVKMFRSYNIPTFHYTEIAHE